MLSPSLNEIKCNSYCYNYVNSYDGCGFLATNLFQIVQSMTNLMSKDLHLKKMKYKKSKSELLVSDQTYTYKQFPRKNQ